MYERIRSHIFKHISLSEEEFNTFTSLLKYRKLKRRQYLLQAADICRYEAFVIKGCLRTYITDDKGQEHVLQFAIEDWWAGDLHSFLTGSPSAYNIEALEETELLLLDNDSLEKLYQLVPRFERYYRIIIQNAYIALQKRVLNSMSSIAEDRYLDFINKYPQLEQRLPQHQVAAYLGITPEFLSRIRSNRAARK